MLIMFKTRNFMSFKDEVIIDFRATSYIQHPTHVLEINDKMKVLKTTAIYGANASGKSNLISAMYFFKKYIFEQFLSNRKSDNTEIDNKFKVELDQFLLSDESDNVSEFEIIFCYNNKIIQYGFECTPDNVLSEWYYINENKVFERNGNKLSFGSQYRNILNKYSKVIPERLHLSVLEYLLDKTEKELVLKDFIDFFIKDYNVYLEIFFEVSIKKVGGMVSFNDKILKDKKYRNKIVSYLKRIDVGISGLEVQKKIVLDEETGKETEKQIVKSIHNVYNSAGEVTGKQYFDLIQESTGTLRFLSYIQNVIEMTENGGVFIVDELSARLHPLLTKLIVDIFQDNSNKKAQLIFTTHDISILNKEQFRRDEVLFVDKDIKGVSKIYALSDLKVREDASFNKDYLQGKYGAIPIFNYDEIIGGD
ncbi:ATP-binding protein [Ruminiclostridium herbifermentans]|uniref:ATP-binding protein n=1 Tax=Ruminiclostridium herbifermentans TaxID=2488810 RepID=A0A4U7JF67_9FIRM|nr:ATP-binding protein [Ruminiclostridium herbifermentans]QNU67418.1 ATP-binding protein [Ruminiclostridium herbifermentans]